MATVFERVKKVTMAQLGVTDSEVHPASSFAGDLGADSLDQVELLMALEEEFSTPEKKITIPDEEGEKMLTVQDAVDFLHGLRISDIEAPPKTAEKSGFPRINIPRPNIQRTNAPRQPRPEGQQERQQGNQPNRQGGAPQQQQRSGQPRRDNRPRRPQGNAPRPNNAPRPQQSAPQNPAAQMTPPPVPKPPEAGNTAV